MKVHELCKFIEENPGIQKTKSKEKSGYILNDALEAHAIGQLQQYKSRFAKDD